MSYCRFHNTLLDLRDCRDALYNGEIPSEEEKRCAQRLIKLCKEIAEDYCEADVDDMFEN